MILTDILSGTDKEIFWLLIYLSFELMLPTDISPNSGFEWLLLLAILVLDTTKIKLLYFLLLQKQIVKSSNNFAVTQNKCP